MLHTDGAIRKLNVAAGQWSTVFNNSAYTAVNVTLFRSRPWLAVDPNGNLFATDPVDHVVRMLPAGGNWTDIGGVNGTSGYQDGFVGAFSGPTSVSYSTGTGLLYIADVGNSRVRVGKSAAVEAMVASLIAEIEEAKVVAAQQRAAVTAVAAAAVATSTAASVATSAAVSASVSALVSQISVKN